MHVTLTNVVFPSYIWIETCIRKQVPQNGTQGRITMRCIEQEGRARSTQAGSDLTDSSHKHRNHDLTWKRTSAMGSALSSPTTVTSSALAASAVAAGAATAVAAAASVVAAAAVAEAAAASAFAAAAAWRARNATAARASL